MMPQALRDWLADWFFIIGGGAGLSYFGWSIIEGQAAKRWPVVMGVVTATHMKVTRTRLGNSYDPQVKYSYTIADRVYSGERRRFGDTDYWLKSSAEARLAQYAVGRPVEVHYHPAHHDRSVLELGITVSTYFGLVFVGLFFAAGVGWLLGVLH